jgi:signal transduction histidine kinase
MTDESRSSTQLNYMLRLPHPQQLVGVVQVEGRRSADQHDADSGLIAAADREGFIDNATFRDLQDIIRGAIEGIAFVDREIQLEEEKKKQRAALRELRAQTRKAIREIRQNRHIRSSDKARLIEQLTRTEAFAKEHESLARERETQLQVMSLLGVLAGFLTHEFGLALTELESSERELRKVANQDDRFVARAKAIREHLDTLEDFVRYSRAYIQGSSSKPTRPYPVKPRIQQVVRIFGKYAGDRGIKIEVEVDSTLLAPLVPVSLYNGVALNLYTNALKAVIAKSGKGDRRIAFRAWDDDGYHYLTVSDTGVGIPSSLRERVFDPLFTTTGSNNDPLGSGLGLGLTVIKRGAEAFNGRVAVVDPPPGFTTCVQMRLPRSGDKG